MKKMLLIVIAVVVLGAGAGAAYFVLGRGEPPDEVVEQPVEPGLVSMETFMVNVNDPGGDRYAKLTLRLTITPAEAAEAIAQDEIQLAKMRDRVLTLLTAKSYQDLISPVGKEGFRRELKARLGPLLKEGTIEEVLFSEFVVQ